MYSHIHIAWNGYITDVETNWQTHWQIIAVIGKRKLDKMWPDSDTQCVHLCNSVAPYLKSILAVQRHIDIRRECSEHRH